MLSIVISLIAGAMLLFYNYWISVYTKWTKKKIVSISGKFPFGSSVEFGLKKRFPGHIIDEMYHKEAEHPYFGIYAIRTPWLVVKDPEIIRVVLMKEFTHFRDREVEIAKEDHLSQHLFALTGERWRVLRVKLTPTFTSGKMKAMFPLFVSCADAFNDLLLSKVDTEVDIKEFTTRFTTDVISSCAFGLESNAIADPDHALNNLGKFFRKKRWLSLILDLVLKAFPELPIRRRGFPIEVEQFMLKLVRDTVEYREKNGIKRNDFMDLLIQLKDKGKIGGEMEEINETFEMTVELMAAQAFVFLFAGFETSSTVQSFCLYELALHLDIQQRLREEVDQVIEKHGELSYQAVQEMQYLHKVISETMRKYPTIPTLIRICTKPFTMPAGHHLDVGDRIMIPVWSLHHDPQYYPNPEDFDPERFSSGDEGCIKPFTYLPFGEGPRVCIGNRFGLLQTKMGIVSVLRSFQVLPCEKTTVPIELGNASEITMSKSPIILKLVSRNKDI